MEGDAVFDRLWDRVETVEFDDLDPDTIDTAALRIFDSIAVSIRALEEKPIQRVTMLASKKSSDTPANILGTDVQSSLEFATFANCAMMRYLDWNDTYLQTEAAHPSGNIGAILAAADACDLSGREVILATVLSYDIQCRLCDLANFTDNGFDHVNYGLVSVPLALAKLLELDRKEARDATSIAATAHLGLLQARQPPISEWKGYAFANAARNGVISVEMAIAGIHGPADPFLGTNGINSVLNRPLDPHDITFEDGFAVNQTHLKRYPICHHILSGIDAVAALRKRHDIDWREIEGVDVWTYDVAIRVAGDEEKWRPTTRGTADHSIPYCLARYLIDGRIELEDLDGPALSEPDVVELMDRIEVHHDESFTTMYGESFPHRVVIDTGDDKYEETVKNPLGHVDNPLDWKDVAEKLPEQDTTALQGIVESLDERDRLDALFEEANALSEDQS